MRTDDARWLLRAWESGSVAAPAARGAVLCDAAGVTPTLDAALDLGLHELATALAGTYRREFGPTAPGLLTCDGCGEVLDVELPLDRLADSGAFEHEAVVTTPSGRVVRLRVPTTRDLLAIGAHDDPVGTLVARCVADVSHDESAPALDAPLDVDDLAAVDETMLTLAGSAAVTVSATCPSCGARLSAPVDVADFVWQRVQQQAPALLADVADLARAFGWTEQEILALSPVRRSAYLAMVRQASP